MSFTEVFPMTYLSGEQWLAMLPLAAVSVFAILGLVLSPLASIGRIGSFASLCVGSLIGIVSLASQSFESPVLVLDGVLIFDRMSRVFSFFILFSALGAALMSLGFDRREQFQNEYYSLIAFAAAGMLALVSTRDLVFFFIALELMSLAVYVLVSMHRQSPLAAEAGLKYFLLGGAASAVLLYGTTLLYGATGSLNVAEMHEAFQRQWGGQSLPLLPLLGFGLLAIGLLFKIGAVPFHVWVPDVYTGAATPVTGFMISAVKAAAIGALLRFVATLFGVEGPLASDVSIQWILGAVIVVTLVFGSVVGMRQTRLKRLFAYSTIVHTGYALLGFLALMSGGAGAADAISSYTLFYVIMNLGGFAVLTIVSPKDSDDITLDDITGLGRRRPFLAFSLSVFLLSMAGIPPTAGFFGKYYLFLSAISSGHIALTIVAVVASLVSAVIYLRPIVHMYMKDPEASYQPVPVLWWGSSFVVAASLLLTIVMGLLPMWFAKLL